MIFNFNLENPEKYEEANHYAISLCSSEVNTVNNFLLLLYLYFFLTWVGELQSIILSWNLLLIPFSKMLKSPLLLVTSVEKQRHTYKSIMYPIPPFPSPSS